MLFLGLLPWVIHRHGLALLGMTAAIYNYTYLFQLVIGSWELEMKNHCYVDAL